MLFKNMQKGVIMRNIKSFINEITQIGHKNGTLWRV